MNMLKLKPNTTASTMREIPAHLMHTAQAALAGDNAGAQP